MLKKKPLSPHTFVLFQDPAQLTKFTVHNVITNYGFKSLQLG